MKVDVIYNKIISQEEKYNCFPDLTWHENKYWLPYRSGIGHATGLGEIINI